MPPRPGRRPPASASWRRSNWRTSSRSAGSTPFIRFAHDKKLYRLALEVKGLAKGYDGTPLFSGLHLTVAVGERVAIIGPNGIGKTTLLRSLAG